MEKLKLLISKKVISLEEGKLCGYILDLVFDAMLKNFEGCVVADDENEGTFFLKKKDIISQGEDCVVIEKESVLDYDFSSSTSNPIGKKVYDTKGINLGVVLDVLSVGKNVKKIITDKCEIPQNLIQKSGDDFIIFGLCKKNKNKKNKPIFKNMEKLNKISENLPKIEINSQINLNNDNNINNSQMRIFANPNILLGRTITTDLFGMNNELIARKNEIINKKILNNAKNHNKLNILSYFSK